MGHVGEKDGVLLSRRLQLSKDIFVPFPLGGPPVDPVSCKGCAAKDHNGAKSQTEYLLQLQVP